MKSEEELKYCANCKHFYAYTDMTSLCYKSAFKDMVTGRTGHEDCSRIRNDEFRCGRRAAWFEEKQK